MQFDITTLVIAALWQMDEIAESSICNTYRRSEEMITRFDLQIKKNRLQTWMDGWMGGRADGQTGGQADRQADRRTDRETARQRNNRETDRYVNAVTVCVVVCPFC